MWQTQCTETQHGATVSDSESEEDGLPKTTKMHGDEEATPVGEPIDCQTKHIEEDSSMAIGEFYGNIAFEAYSNALWDFMLEGLVDSHSKPYPPYQQRVKGSLRIGATLHQSRTEGGKR